jgi:hypothetical protein
MITQHLRCRVWEAWVPSDPPEVLRYLRAIGIGRNIDAYA